MNMEKGYEQKSNSIGLDKLRELKEAKRDWGQRHPRLFRFVSASLIPLALLAAGCEGEKNKGDGDDRLAGPEYKQNNKNTTEAKWLFEKIAGDRYVMEGAGATIDLGGGDYYFLDQDDLADLSSFVQTQKNESPFLQSGDKKFGRTEEKAIAIAGEKMIRQVGEKVSAEELPYQLRASEKARVDLGDWLEETADESLETKTEEEAKPSDEKHVNPDLADFL